MDLYDMYRRRRKAQRTSWTGHHPELCHDYHFGVECSPAIGTGADAALSPVRTAGADRQAMGRSVRQDFVRGMTLDLGTR